MTTKTRKKNNGEYKQAIKKRKKNKNREKIKTQNSMVDIDPNILLIIIKINEKFQLKDEIVRLDSKCFIDSYIVFFSKDLCKIKVQNEKYINSKYQKLY